MQGEWGMPLIDWDDKFLLGIPQLDEHHRQLVKLLNQAFDGFTAKAPAEEVSTLLEALADYATYHFAAEENWMKANGYPWLREHAAEHDKFSARVTEMLHDVSADKPALPLELLTFLKNWLVEHILTTDADYGRFFRTQTA
jgi:hemerythrin